MSRTDVHRPVWVLMQDPTIRHWFEDFHHHESGVCDLDEYLATDGGAWSRDQCYRQLWRQAPRLCSCDLCRGDEPLTQRRERRHWRRVREHLMKAQRDDLWDVDSWAPLRERLW